MQGERPLEQLHERGFIAHLRDGERRQAIKRPSGILLKGNGVVRLQTAAGDAEALRLRKGQKLYVGAEKARLARGGAIGQRLPHAHAELVKDELRISLGVAARSYAQVC